MLGHDYRVPFADGLTLLTVAFGLLWLRLAGRRPAELCGQTALTVSGYLRRRPDRAAETRLRAAFSELDRELTAVLGDRPPARRP
jgi:hypothetical protein